MSHKNFIIKLYTILKIPQHFLLYIIVLPRRLISPQFLSLTELSMQQMKCQMGVRDEP